MIKRTYTFVLVTVLLFAVGCDVEDRVGKLEKQNQELNEKVKAETEKIDVSAVYDLQAKCSKDAKSWFNENWPSDKDTILLTFTNHYNKAQNKCFILIEYHFKSNPTGTRSWTNNTSLWDVYENLQYGQFMENHSISYAPTVETKDRVYECQFSGQKCKTEEEFNNFVRPYLTN